MQFFRKWGVSLLLIAAFLGAFVAVGVLQEFRKDEIPAHAETLGLSLPLGDPNVYVSTSRGVLELRDGEVVVRRYDCAFGKGAVFGQLGGDPRATPTGEFHVVEKGIRKDVAARGSRFIRVDFPNVDAAERALASGAIDRAAFDAVRAAAALGLPPPEDVLGGPLGIQGNRFFFSPRRDTDGSIGLSNADVIEVFAHLPVGAPVVIGD